MSFFNVRAPRLVGACAHLTNYGVCQRALIVNVEGLRSPIFVVVFDVRTPRLVGACPRSTAYGVC